MKASGPVNYEKLMYGRATEIEPGESLYGTLRLVVPPVAPADIYTAVLEVGMEKWGYYVVQGYCEVEVEVIP